VRGSRADDLRKQTMAGKPLDEAHLREALSLVEGGDVEAAIKQLTPMVSRKRFTRPSGRVAEPLEIEEVTGWLATALEDPTADDAPFFVERAYYKLRRYRSGGPGTGR
jgi:hypothetical protein